MTLDPDCVSVRIDNSAASANSLLCKIMLAVKSVLNCGGRGRVMEGARGRQRHREGEREQERESERGERVEAFAFSVLSGSSVQTCCSVESKPSSSDSYP